MWRGKKSTLAIHFNSVREKMFIATVAADFAMNLSSSLISRTDHQLAYHNSKWVNVAATCKVPFVIQVQCQEWSFQLLGYAVSPPKEYRNIVLALQNGCLISGHLMDNCFVYLLFFSSFFNPYYITTILGQTRCSGKVQEFFACWLFHSNLATICQTEIQAHLVHNLMSSGALSRLVKTSCMDMFFAAHSYSCLLFLEGSISGWNCIFFLKEAWLKTDRF